MPDPISMYESARNAGLEREIADKFVSAAFSAAIAGMWRSGSAKWAGWTGESQALRDAATAMYLSLTAKQIPGIVLTVPSDMVTPDNLSKFITESRGG